MSGDLRQIGQNVRCRFLSILEVPVTQHGMSEVGGWKLPRSVRYDG